MGHNFGGEPRLVLPAAGTGWVNAFVGVMLVGEVVLLIALLESGETQLWSIFVVLSGLGFTALLVWAIIPRSFEVYDDRLILVFTLWRWTIAMDSIELVRPATFSQSYAYGGIRFATSPGKAVELRRLRSNFFSRPNLIISPNDREFFVTEMNAALARFQRLHGAPL